MSTTLLEAWCVEHVWIIHCSRCANEDTSYAVGSHKAIEHFVAAGWTREQQRIFCPACNEEVGS